MQFPNSLGYSARLAFSHNWEVFVSHRSGKTTDDFIADLTVGLGTGHFKSGASCRGERVAKYNRLMDIEAELKANEHACQYAGQVFFLDTVSAYSILSKIR